MKLWFNLAFTCSIYLSECVDPSLPFITYSILEQYDQYFYIIPIFFIKLSQASIFRLNSMRKKNIMGQIQEQVQQAKSISLNSQSVIEEYNQLQFSDEIQRDQNSSSDAELSVDKLKFLGIDMFPGQYAYHISKNRDNSDTREDFSRKQVNEKAISFSEESRMGNGLYSRKNKKSKNKQISLNQPQQINAQECQQYFNIDSFLNSRPIHRRRPTQKQLEIKAESKYKNKSHNYSRVRQSQMDRTQYNSNAFKNILQEPNKTKKETNKNTFSKEPWEKNRMQKSYAQKNKKIKSFIQLSIRKQHEMMHQKYKDYYNSNPNSSEQSITLITLPEPKQVEQESEKNMKKYHKKSTPMPYQNSLINEEFQSAKLFQIRFEQAKIGFMDCFLPQSMKISKSPYNFWRYANSKSDRFRMM